MLKKRVDVNRLLPLAVLGVAAIVAPFLIYASTMKTRTPAAAQGLPAQAMCEEGAQPFLNCPLPTGVQRPVKPDLPADKSPETMRQYHQKVQLYRQQMEIYKQRVLERIHACTWSCTPFPSGTPRPSITRSPLPTSCPVDIQCPMNCIQTKMAGRCDVCECGQPGR